MKTITFIGDIHLFHIAPSSRRDDYPSIVLEKIEKVGEYSPSDIYICTGDICHKPVLPDKYKNRIIPAFNSLGKPVFSIIGNHDVPNYNLQRIDSVSLGVLFESGVLSHLEVIKFKVGSKKYCIIGCDYGEDVPEPLPGYTNILVAHAFYSSTVINTDEVKLQDEDLKGYEHVVLGHDHAKYEPFLNKYGTTIHRPGSLTRGTCHSYNLSREISVLKMTFGEDGVNAEFVTIPSSEVKSAFKRKVFDDKIPSTKGMITFIKKFLNVNISEAPIFSILEALDIEDSEVRIYVENVLLNSGFIKN